MKIVWVLLQTTRELSSFYVFEPLIQSLGTGQLRLRKSSCLLISETVKVIACERISIYKCNLDVFI